MSKDQDEEDQDKEEEVSGKFRSGIPEKYRNTETPKNLFICSSPGCKCGPYQGEDDAVWKRHQKLTGHVGLKRYPS